MLPPFTVVIPCFNEEARIAETLRGTLDYLTANAPESELIVVNDGSTDATATIARERLETAKIKTRLLENFPNRGKGAAVRSGLLAAQKPIAHRMSRYVGQRFARHPDVSQSSRNSKASKYRFDRIDDLGHDLIVASKQA